MLWCRHILYLKAAYKARPNGYTIPGGIKTFRESLDGILRNYIMENEKKTGQRNILPASVFLSSSEKYFFATRLTIAGARKNIALLLMPIKIWQFKIDFLKSRKMAYNFWEDFIRSGRRPFGNKIFNFTLLKIAIKKKKVNWRPVALASPSFPLFSLNLVYTNTLTYTLIAYHNWDVCLTIWIHTGIRVRSDRPINLKETVSHGGTNTTWLGKAFTWHTFSGYISDCLSV